MLLDISLADENGIGVTRRLKSNFPHIAVILFTIDDELEQMLAAILAGARGYCSKDIALEGFLENLRHVGAGEYLLQEKVYSADEIQAWVVRAVQKLGKTGATTRAQCSLRSTFREIPVL
jgi:DNA-binding NarL/FixJ family response regulator